MENYISYVKIQNVINTIIEYQKNKDKLLLENIQDDIKLIKNIDYSIKTSMDYAQKSFVESSHGVSRIAMFLLNYYGEHYLNNSYITIKNDDFFSSRYKHNTKYQLELKDAETHNVLFFGNPTAADAPYDFNTKFISQSTCYDTGEKDNTEHPWDSFTKKYIIPHRKLDFKSAFWSETLKHNTHNVDYIIKLCSDSKLNLYYNYNKNLPLIEKQFDIEIFEDNLKYYKNYFELLNLFDQFKNLSWNDFIV